MQLDLAVLLNLGGMVVSATALIVGIRGKLDTLKASIETELQHINGTLREAITQLTEHESNIRDLQWHTGLKGNGVDSRLKKGS